MKLPHVEFAEIDWTTIDAAWLREQEVQRVYIAPHKQPNQIPQGIRLLHRAAPGRRQIRGQSLDKGQAHLSYKPSLLRPRALGD